MIKNKAITYSDVHIVPKYSEIESRSNVDLSVSLGDLDLDLPIIASPMESVMGVEMMDALHEKGATGAYHRFDNTKDLTNRLDRSYMEDHSNVIQSIGVSNEVPDVIRFGIGAVSAVLIDVAHGHHKYVKQTIDTIKSEYPDTTVIAGNIATPEAALDLIQWGADILRVGVGGGCFASGTKILMANGTYKNIEDIEPGEEVINKNGNPVEVKKRIYSGKQRVIEYDQNNFHKNTHVTPDHKHWVGDYSSCMSTKNSQGYKKALNTPKNNGEKIKWKEVGDLENCCLLSPSNIDFSLPDSFNVSIEDKYNRDNKEKYSELFPNYNVGYIFGTYLGDGYSRSTKGFRTVDKKDKTTTTSIYWSFGPNERDIAEKLVDCLRSEFPNSRVWIQSPTEIKDNIHKVNLSSSGFARFTSNEFKNENGERFLPSEYLVNNDDYLQGLYDGLIDSDGRVRNNTENKSYRFFNTSEKLVELFNVLTYLVEGHFPYSTKREKRTGNLKGTSVDKLKDPFVSSSLSKPNRRIVRNKYQVSPLKKIDSSNTERVKTWDLWVDDETHSFVANNVIVHNSVCTTRMQTGVGVPMISCIEEISKEVKTKNRELHGVRDNKIRIVADGGMKTPGDIAKALAAGADAAMLGSMLSGTDEAPGEIIEVDGTKMKKYYGSASFEQKGENEYVEGVSELVEYKGLVTDILDDIRDGLQSACSYVGVENLKQFRNEAELIEVSQNGYQEAKPHI